MSERVLIAGAGFVGERLAEILGEAGWGVTALVRHEESAVDMRGRQDFEVLAADLADLENLRGALGEHRRFDAVVHCASSGRGGAEKYRAVFLGGVKNLRRLFPEAYLVFTSSTSVYGQRDGSVVTEDSVTEPDRETGRILLEAERVVCDAGGAVARLAGLYGPRRSVILRKFLSGDARIEDGGTRHLNQIHRDDAAAALARILREQPRGEIFNVADDEPMMQADCYRRLAEFYERPLPPPGHADPNRKRGITDKQVSNHKIRALGWAPRYRNFLEAVKADPALDG